MNTDERPDIAKKLHSELGAERGHDRFATVTLDGTEARRLLDELHSARRDTEMTRARCDKAGRRVADYRSQCGALMVDRDRARGWAAELAESALRAAAERGIDADDVARQIAHDRWQRWLQLRQETWWEVAFSQVMGVVGMVADAARQDRAQTYTAGWLAERLNRAVERGKRDREVDRRCGTTWDQKDTLPDLTIPPLREVTGPDDSDLVLFDLDGAA